MAIYQYIRLVTSEDVDELQHVNNVVYLSMLQEAAIAHWNTLADKKTQESLRWIVRKHEIEYFAPAFVGDQITIHTWVQTAEGASSERVYEITKDGKTLVKAKTLWIAVDPISLRPLRISDSIKQLLEVVPGE